MRGVTRMICALLLGMTAIAALTVPRWSLAGKDSQDKRATPLAVEKDRLVVHEWGTFTNFAGADGVQLDFRPLVDNELPPFVHDGLDLSIFTKRRVSAYQRMETPVTYFYTNRDRRVNVRVDFPKGLLTEFYPPVRQIEPAFRFVTPPVLENAFLDWGSVRIYPEELLRNVKLKGPKGEIIPVNLPAVVGDNHYAFARETDSAIVETLDAFKNVHVEKFLFYRGIGNFQLPLHFEALGNGRFTVTNFGPEPVSGLFLVQIDGNEVRYTEHASIPTHGAVHLEQSKQPADVEQLGEAVVQSLVAAGLYEKEAKAMVKTWRSSWFGEDGTRLLYQVPRRLTDEVLPLKVDPLPDDIVRVLIGRMEILTPEAGMRLADVIRQQGTCFSIEAEPLASELAKLGRFAEPAIGHLLAHHPRIDIRPQLEALHASLSQQER